MQTRLTGQTTFTTRKGFSSLLKATYMYRVVIPVHAQAVHCQATATPTSCTLRPQPRPLFAQLYIKKEWHFTASNTQKVWPVSDKMAKNVEEFKVSVESLHTTRVKEINYEGEEIYQECVSLLVA